MQPLNVLPKIYPVISKHAFNMYFLIFFPLDYLCCNYKHNQKHPGMHQRLDLCDKDSFLDQKLFSKPKQIFVVLHLYTTDWVLAYLCILCIPLYHVYVLSPTYKHFFHSNADWNKIKFVISVFECYLSSIIILNLFVRFFGVGIVVLSKIILTKKVDTIKMK